MSSGFEVEVEIEIELGFAPSSWASTGPPAPGTAGVVRHGCVALYDPHAIVANLVTAVG